MGHNFLGRLTNVGTHHCPPSHASELTSSLEQEENYSSVCQNSGGAKQGSCTPMSRSGSLNTSIRVSCKGLRARAKFPLLIREVSRCPGKATFGARVLGCAAWRAGPAFAVFPVLRRHQRLRIEIPSKISAKTKSSSTANLPVKSTVRPNTRTCWHAVFLFIRTPWNSAFLFCGRLTFQNSMKNQKLQI